MSYTLIAPSVSSRTANDGAVVVIGVDRHPVGGDNGAHLDFRSQEG
jgi:hypothetical protein